MFLPTVCFGLLLSLVRVTESFEPRVAYLSRCGFFEGNLTSFSTRADFDFGSLPSNCSPDLFSINLERLLKKSDIQGLLAEVPQSKCHEASRLARAHRKPLVTWNCTNFLDSSEDTPGNSGLRKVGDEQESERKAMFFRSSANLLKLSPEKMMRILSGLQSNTCRRLTASEWSSSSSDIQNNWAQLWSSLKASPSSADEKDTIELDLLVVRYDVQLSGNRRNSSQTSGSARAATRSRHLCLVDVAKAMNSPGDPMFVRSLVLLRNWISETTKIRDGSSIMGTGALAPFHVNLDLPTDAGLHLLANCCLLFIGLDETNQEDAIDEAIELLRTVLGTNYTEAADDDDGARLSNSSTGLRRTDASGKVLDGRRRSRLYVRLFNYSPNESLVLAEERNITTDSTNDTFHPSKCQTGQMNCSRREYDDQKEGEQEGSNSRRYLPGVMVAQQISYSLVALIGILVAIIASFVAIARKKLFEKELEKKILLKPSDLEAASMCASHSNASQRFNPCTLRLDGKPVLLKEINTHQAIQLKAPVTRHFCQLYEMRHENLNTFLGFLNSDSITYMRPCLVWEQCSHGSLFDALANENIHLDWSFKLSLLIDLARGMKYLHAAPINYHGWLSSYNCVIDSRWLLKVTDFGLQKLYQLQNLPPPKLDMADYLWVAPELLRKSLDLAQMSGSQAGDVYSFGIIIAEVVSRESPERLFGDMSPEQVIEHVQRPFRSTLRPTVDLAEDTPLEVMTIARACWAEAPETRPTFGDINDFFKKFMIDGKKSNLVDNMFHKLEKYSSSLEEMVKDRTALLEEERKKTDLLLSRMLPPSVACSLKAGIEVMPEKFENATVFFSDIVGFTTISAYSEPLEIVTLLNDLYTIFDTTLDKHNVYKVETIGDAYMVVSGVPNRNKDHAEQIATMALDLLHVCANFKIRHMPSIPLLLRIGINSGSVVGGIVGHAMPRYCLFGDTVNIASRMESTGRAFRIHISKSTEELLGSTGQYLMKYRGEVAMKGKGKQPTYWLLGKRGFDKQLPEPPADEYDENSFDNEDTFTAIGRRKMNSDASE